MGALGEHRPDELMRRANDMIWESLGLGGRREPVAFFCECSDPACYRAVWLTPDEYEAARQEPGWAPLADHETFSAA